MSVARQFRGTLGELAGEAGDIILLVLGLIVFFAVFGPLRNIFGAVIGIIPGAGSLGQTATMQRVGTVGDVLNVGGGRRIMPQALGPPVTLPPGVFVRVPGPTTGYPYPYTPTYNPYSEFGKQQAFFIGQGLIAPQAYARGPRIIGREVQ